MSWSFLRLSTFFLLTRSSTIPYTSHIHVFCKARKNYDINTRHTRFVSREEGDL